MSWRVCLDNLAPIVASLDKVTSSLRPNQAHDGRHSNCCYHRSPHLCLPNSGLCPPVSPGSALHLVSALMHSCPSVLPALRPLNGAATWRPAGPGSGTPDYASCPLVLLVVSRELVMPCVYLAHIMQQTVTMRLQLPRVLGGISGSMFRLSLACPSALLEDCVVSVQA